MLDILALFCLLGAVALLIILTVIDMKIRLLPNEYVAGFAVFGLGFHLASANFFLSWTEILIGGGIGFGLLYGIRAAANAYYKQDSLGLGDVKLLGAAGLWLGLDGVLFAMTTGAFAGLVHGIAYAAWLSWKNKTPFTIRRLTIPAGPGFAAGIVAVGGVMFHGYVLRIIAGFFS